MDPDKITVEWLAAEESFQAYCLGIASPEQVRKWQSWEAAHPEQEALVAQARELVLAVSAQVSSTEIKTEWQRFRQAAQAEVVPMKSDRRRLLLRIAATVLLLIGGYWSFQQLQPVPMQSIVTIYGETQHITLPDGSKLDLNANSTVRFAEDWSRADHREVWLEGQAFFDVEHNPAQSFLVHTAEGDVEVLGTSFDVVNRSKNIRITLVEGSVQFHLAQQSQPILLKPNEQLAILNDTLSKQAVDAVNLTVWRHGRMEFKNTPIAEIIKQLQDNYGWSVQVRDDMLLQRKVTAKVPENDPVLLLEALSVLYDLKIVKVADRRYRIE